ncbi:MAG: hypothetical protein AAGU27_10165 [Dehalobacterium sp.]
MENNEFQGKVLEYLAQLTQNMTEMRQDINKIEDRVTRIEDRVTRTEDRVTKIEDNVTKTNMQIENNISPKISALFDGWQQHTNQLNRIEEKVSSHEELIIKRIK